MCTRKASSPAKATQQKISSSLLRSLLISLILCIDEVHSGEPSTHGAKHKSKAHDKEERSKKHGDENGSGKDDKEGRKHSSKGDKEKAPKEKKHKEVLKDANGNDLKRPLTAYMLFNNFRRPVLQKDHPGECCPFPSNLAGVRLLAD